MVKCTRDLSLNTVDLLRCNKMHTAVSTMVVPQIKYIPQCRLMVIVYRHLI